MRRGIWALAAVALLYLPMVGLGQTPPYIIHSSATSADWNLQAPVLWGEFTNGSTTTSGGLDGWVCGTGTCTFGGEQNHPGYVQNACAAGPATCYFVPNNNNFVVALSDIEYLLGVSYWTTGANIPTARFGLTGSAGNLSPATHSVYFEKLTTDTNWFAVVRGAASETRADTGVAFVGSTYPVFEIKHPVASRWDFYINNVAVASHTSGNLPTETTINYPLVQVTTTGTAIDLRFDYFRLKLRVTR